MTFDTANVFSSSEVAASGLADLVSKRIAPISDWTAMSGADHFVQFYESDSHILSAVAEWVVHGLKSGETCILAATPEHVAAVEPIVTAFGADLESAKLNGKYIFFDAGETIERFMTDGTPDRALFDEVVGNVVREATGRGPVRIFGEMVALLASASNSEAALKVEEFWNVLRKERRFSLFCAYPIAGFTGDASHAFMHSVCSEHSRIIPAESYTSLRTADERLRAVAFLQQRSRQLEAELAVLEASISSRNLSTQPA